MAKSTKASADLKNLEDYIVRSQKDQIVNSKELNSLAEDLTDVWKDLSDTIKSVAKNANALGDSFDDIVDYTKTITKNLRDIGTEFYEEIKYGEKISNLQNKIKETAEEINSLEDTRAKTIKLIEKYNQLGNKNAVKTLENINESKLLAINQLKLQAESYAVQEKSLQSIIGYVNLLDIANKKAKEYGISVSDISKEIAALFESSLSFLNNVPGGGLLRKFFGLDSALEKVQQAVMKSFITGLSESKSVGTAAFGALRAGASAFIAALGPLLPVLLAISAVLYSIKKAFDLDQEITDLAKGLAVSKKSAVELNNQFIAIAANTKVVGANTKALAESYSELANSFGVSQLASAELAETQVYLKTQIGLAAEEAAEFQKFSMLSGRSAEQNLAVIKTAVDTLSGGLLNYKSVVKDIAKSSAAVQASYKGNITALAKAAVQAKKLGMTLADTKEIAESFLDIETSIGSEMEANVLTGKHMNMEHARELALRGETAEAVAEAVKQAGTYDELMSMESYQRAAIAKAAGTTVDKLIEAAQAQKNLNSIANTLGITLQDNTKLTDEQIAQAAAMGNEEAKKLAIANQQAAAQEKLAQLGDKLMLIFSKLATPLVEMLDPLMQMIDTIFPALEVAIKVAFFPLVSAAKILTGIVNLFSRNSITSDSLDTPKAMNDGIINPDGLAVMSPKGTYSLNPNDSIVAGTNINARGGTTSTVSSNSRIESLLEKLIAKVDQPVQIVMGGRVIDELDTRTTLRKTYNTSVDQGYGVFG